MKSVFHDNNYKLRIDGVIFLKEYIANIKNFKCKRLHSIYVPELLDFLQDEDNQIKIDSIEALCEILEEVDDKDITELFIPQVLFFMDF